MKKIILIASACSILLTGCATPYQKGGRFGYRDSQLQENVFSVSFQGNAKCEPQDVQDYTLLRCAELCVQNGYKYFALNTTGAGAKTGMYNTGGSATTYGTMNTVGSTTYGNFNTYGSGGFAVPIHLPNFSAIVTCYQEKPEHEVFDAEFLGRSIAEKHGYVFTDGRVSKPKK